MKKIEDYIYVKNHINKHLCDEILKNIKKQKWNRHNWYYYGSNTEQSLDQDADVLHCSLENQNKLMPTIFNALHEYQKLNHHKEAGINFITKHTGIRFNNYKKGMCMAYHYDHIHSIFDGKEKGVPILSVVGLLNDDFKGGEFEICNKKIKLKKGDIIIFPSCFIYAHKVNPVKSKQSRYSFVCWTY